MRTSISVDLGSFDLYLRDLAEEVVTNSLEEDLLLELSAESESISRASGDEAEERFAHEAAVKLAELAKWFKENAP